MAISQPRHDLRPSRQRTRLSKDDRRARILSAAIEAIGEQGYHGFSIKALAARCGMTDAGLLHHFGSKVGLLTAVLDERDRQDEAAIADLLGPEAGRVPQSGAALRHLLRALVGRNAGRPELIRLYAVLRAEALAEDHPAHRYFRTRDAEVLRIFTGLLGHVSGDPARLARQILIAIDGIEMQWLREQGGFDLLDEWDRLSARLIGD